MLSLLRRPLGLALSGVTLVALVALAWFALQVDPIFSSPGAEVVITVQSGDSTASVAAQLHAKGVIASALAFRAYDLITGGVIRPGSYSLRQHSTFLALTSVFNKGPNVLDVTAGQTLHEVALNVANFEGSSWANTFVTDLTSATTPSPFTSGSSLEGLIGAGYYAITSDTTPSSLARAMVSAFTKEAATQGLTPTTTLNGLNAYQLVIAASIVEKEGYYPVNMPRTARVIFNRLARGGPLQMDSTVLYYLGQDGGTVTPSDLQLHTPYNTYLNNGLTPTPICTVSSIALHSVLHAPPGPWLYFELVKKDGTMQFSATFKQQLYWEHYVQVHGLQ